MYSKLEKIPDHLLEKYFELLMIYRCLSCLNNRAIANLWILLPVPR